LEGEDGEPEVPDFAKAHEALVKIRSFFYVHRNSDGDRDCVLSLERSFFELQCKISTKHVSITELLHKN
jgi:hypothetical protein